MRIKLVCSCGAMIETVTDSNYEAKIHIDSWHERHKNCKDPNASDIVVDEPADPERDEVKDESPSTESEPADTF